ncbi:hypothetical protein OTB74_37250, partial [Streptomyces sp. H34-S4]
MNMDVGESDPMVQLVEKYAHLLVESGQTTHTMTSTEWVSILTDVAGRDLPARFPSHPSHMSGKLLRLTTLLEVRGIRMTKSRNKVARGITVTVDTAKLPPKAEKQHVPGARTAAEDTVEMTCAKCYGIGTTPGLEFK